MAAKKDVYEIVTDQVIELLEKGTVPWQKPWHGGKMMLPKNLVSKKGYRGINVFLLSVTAASMGYQSPYWLSYKQAQTCGGNVKQGEKSTLVVFWKLLDVEKEEVGETKKDMIPLLRYYRVFNLEQCEGIDPKKLPADAMPAEDEDLLDFDPIEECEKVVWSFANSPEIIHDNERRAYYRPMADIVHMPNKELFTSVEEYYSTLFHELTHSTGHEKRLGRKDNFAVAAFGSVDYSKEELVAEMGAAFLCGITGIVNRTIDNSAAYVQGWLKQLKNDKKLVVQAAAQAQRAVDHMLGVTWEGGE